jgi:hypothetical protein
MEARPGEGQHYLSPTVGKFRESMKEQYAGPAPLFKTGFKYVHFKPIDVGYETGSNSCGKRGFAISYIVVLIHFMKLI